MAFNDQYILGNEFFLYFGDASTGADASAVAYATEATISINAESIDCASKQSGVWSTAIAGQIAWTASTSALYTTSSNFDALYAKMIAREPVYIKMARATIDPSTGEVNPASIKSGSTTYVGPAFLTSLELQTGNNECASYSAEFTGVGALTKSTAS